MLLFIYFLAPFLISLLGFIYTNWAFNKKNKFSQDTVENFLAATLLFLSIFIIFLIPFSTSQLRCRKEMAEFTAMKETIISQRVTSISPLERIKLTEQIIKENKWLAREQFWAKTLWVNWCYDKNFLNLTPIQ